MTIIGEAPAASSAFAVMSCTITFVMQCVRGCCARTRSMHWRTSLRNIRRRARTENSVSTFVDVAAGLVVDAQFFVSFAQFDCELLFASAVLFIVIMFPFASTI